MSVKKGDFTHGKRNFLEGFVDVFQQKNRIVIQTIFFLFLILALRTWQLSVVEKKLYERKAKAPRTKTLIQKPERGEILDREGNALAINRIIYHACVYYDEILEIPRIRFTSDPSGKKIKQFPRKTYIERLSHVLAKELSLDPEFIEDTIHSKAALFPHTPYVIKKNLSEAEYYRLRMLQRNFPGACAEISSERHYPYGKVACDVLGHMGAIQKKEYVNLQKRLFELQEILEDYESGELVDFPPYAPSYQEALTLVKVLQKRGYSPHDSVGKMGIEKAFEEPLRGLIGKKRYEVGVKGNFLRKISEEPAVSGENIQLNLSVKMQEYAEKLLAEDEKTRDSRSYIVKKEKVFQKQPWIKGGAIVAFDPNNGEVLTLASHPRFNPNDFIRSGNQKTAEIKTESLHNWLESKTHIAHIWEGKKQLVRERYDKKRGFYEEEMPFSWRSFLELILEGDILKKALTIDTVEKAVLLQEEIEFFLYHSKQKNLIKIFRLFYGKNSLSDEEKIVQARLAPFQKRIALFKKNWPCFQDLSDHRDQAFLIDLVRLIVFSPSFSNELLEECKTIDLETYFSSMQETKRLESYLKKSLKELFHKVSFSPWRKTDGKAFLQKKRSEEKKRKKYSTPYIDLLEKEEKKQFEQFWKKHRWAFLTCFLKGEKGLFKKQEELSPYFSYLIWLKTQKTFVSLENLQHFSERFSAGTLSAFLKTFRSFHEMSRPLYVPLKSFSKNSVPLEKHLAGSFYPFTGFGFAKSYAYQENLTLGSIFKAIVAYSALCKRMREISSSKDSLNPFTFVDQVRYDRRASDYGGLVVGYNEEGKPYPRYYLGGRLPKSSRHNIGKIGLQEALERTSNPYFSLLAKTYLDSPNDLLYAVKSLGLGEKTGIELSGEISGNLPKDLDRNTTGLYSFAIGQHSLNVTALQTACMLGCLANGEKFQPKIVRRIGEKKTEPNLSHFLYYPEPIREYLLEGLSRVISGEKGTARSKVNKGFLQNRALKKRYEKTSPSLVGKTSTAQVRYNPNVYPSSKPQTYQDIWFGLISFEEDLPKWSSPELVVVVYLRFGDAGKEAVSLAYQMLEKYRELKKTAFCKSDLH